jgi:hypothetical protein
MDPLHWPVSPSHWSALDQTIDDGGGLDALDPRS